MIVLASVSDANQGSGPLQHVAYPWSALLALAMTAGL